jgi:hypothetical protein
MNCPWFHKLLLGLVAVFALCNSAYGQKTSSNRIIVLLDRSASFEKDLADAYALTVKYIRTVASTAGEDEVYVIGVDNAPRIIAYIRGVRSRRLAQKELKDSFSHVNPGIGTDYVTALRKASELLQLPPTPTSGHLLVFGDLQVDPQKDPVSHRLIKKFSPLSEMKWSLLTGVHATFYFADDDVRSHLLADTGFQSIGARIYSIESRTRARDEQPPDPADTGKASGNGVPWPLYGAGILVIGGVGFMLRRPPGRRRHE